MDLRSAEKFHRDGEAKSGRVVSTRPKRDAGAATEVPVRLLTWCFMLCLALLAISFWSTAAHAQELAPRAYWPAPKGTNVLVFGYQYSTGDIVTDPSSPITGVGIDKLTIQSKQI